MTGARTVAVVALVIVASRLPAQQANASPAAFGMGNNATATAQGYDAVKWNPALLALPTNTAFSFSLAAVSAVQGLTPVSFDDVAKFGGRTIDPATKEEWLQRIGTGTQDGRLSAGVSAVGLSMGTLGFQLSATGYGTAKLNQDAAEVLLFGNAGRAGSARTLQFAGSRVNGGAFTTGAASFAMPLKNVNSLTPARLAIGVTGKFILGNGYVRAEDNGSVLTPTNIAVRFPMITNRSGETNVGTGLGLDAGLAWHSGSVARPRGAEHHQYLPVGYHQARCAVRRRELQRHHHDERLPGIRLFHRTAVVS